MHTDHKGQLGLLHKDRCACQRQNQLINVDRAAGSDGRGAVLWSYLNSRKVFAIDAWLACRPVIHPGHIALLHCNIAASSAKNSHATNESRFSRRGTLQAVAVALAAAEGVSYLVWIAKQWVSYGAAPPPPSFFSFFYGYLSLSASAYFKLILLRLLAKTGNCIWPNWSAAIATLPLFLSFAISLSLSVYRRQQQQNKLLWRHLPTLAEPPCLSFSLLSTGTALLCSQSAHGTKCESDRLCLFVCVRELWCESDCWCWCWCRRQAIYMKSKWNVNASRNAL